MEATSSNIIEKLVREFSGLAGIVLEPSDHLLLKSFVDEIEAAGGLSKLERLLGDQSSQTGDLFHYWLDHLYDIYGKFFTDFRDFKALRHTCISSLLQRKTDKSLTIWCIEPGSGQEAYSLALMLNQAIPELKDWTVTLHTSNQRYHRFKRCQGARFDTVELSQGLPDGMVDHLIDANFEEDGFLVKGKISRKIIHHHSPILEAPKELPLCDIILLRGVHKYLGEAQSDKLLKVVHQKLYPGGFLLLSRDDTSIISPQFRRMNTIHGSALYTKAADTQKVEIDEQNTHQSSGYTVHDLSPDQYKQMVKHLKQLKLLDGIAVGEHDKFMLQFPVRRFSKGDKILHEGEPNTSILGVIEGHLSIWVGTGLLRRPQQLTSLGAGQLIGETSSISRSICTATVAAETDVVVFEISGEILRKHYSKNPSFASRINSMVARRAKERARFQTTNQTFKASRNDEKRDGIGLVNEGRYELDEYALPNGVELTSITPDLLKCFKEFSRNTRLFRALPMTAVETIANLLCAVRVEPDTVLIKEGSWPIGFYLICDGEAEIYKGGGIFRIGQKVAEVSTGAFLGETSVIMGQKASASVISRSPMTLCVLSRELFEYIYNSHESFALEIDRICAERK